MGIRESHVGYAAFVGAFDMNTRGINFRLINASISRSIVSGIPFK